MNPERDLKRPFPINKLRWRQGQGNSGELVYITARDVMDRLDDVLIDVKKENFAGNKMNILFNKSIENDYRLL